MHAALPISLQHYRLSTVGFDHRLHFDQSGYSKCVHEHVYPQLPYATPLRRPAQSDRFAANSQLYSRSHYTYLADTSACTQAAAARFLKETERTALRTTKLAAKLAVQLGKAGAKASAGGAAIASAEAASLLELSLIHI